MNVTQLVPNLLSHAPTAPDVLLERALVDAAREFCEETRYWVDDTITMDTVANQDLYSPTLPADSVLVDFAEVEYEGQVLTPATPHTLARELGAKWRTLKDVPKFYMRFGVSMVRIVPFTKDAATAALRFTVELKPALGATVLDDVFAEPFSETIVNGALARLFAISDKSWSSVAKADRYLNLFYSKISEARSRADNARTRGVTHKITYRD